MPNSLWLLERWREMENTEEGAVMDLLRARGLLCWSHHFLLLFIVFSFVISMHLLVHAQFLYSVCAFVAALFRVNETPNIDLWIHRASHTLSHA